MKRILCITDKFLWQVLLFHTEKTHLNHYSNVKISFTVENVKKNAYYTRCRTFIPACYR